MLIILKFEYDFVSCYLIKFFNQLQNIIQIKQWHTVCRNSDSDVRDFLFTGRD